MGQFWPSKEKTTSGVSLQDTQSVYQSSVVNNVQNCNGIPPDSNIINVTGNFNDLSNISQYLNDNSVYNCTFQAVNQQQLQDQLVANMTAQALSNVQAPVDVESGFGLLFSLHNGALLNKTDIDVGAIQNAVSTVVSNQIQNCNSGNCNPSAAGNPNPTQPPTVSAVQLVRQLNSGSPSCGGMCAPSGGQTCASSSSCGAANTNTICVDGNFNNVTNVEQSLNLDWVQNCLYSEQTNQNTTNYLNTQMNAIAQNTTTTGFTLLGWIVYLAVFFIIIGVVILGARWLYRVSQKPM